VRVLICGAGGQVGGALSALAPTGMHLSPFTHAELDIADAQAVARTVRACEPQVIVNAAAYTAVDRAEGEPQLAQRVNGTGPGTLAAAARECGARLVHISTDYVFDGTACRPYAPESPTRPLGVYGHSKLAGEQAVLATDPAHAVILRTAWIYAAQGRNFVHTMLRVMQANGAVRVVADQVGSPTTAGSVAEAIWSLIAQPQISGVHHWTDAGVASWYDFAVAIAEEGSALGLITRAVTVTPIRTEDYPTPAQRPAYSVLDCRSLAALKLTPVHWRVRLRGVLEQIRDG
jgi:dTDP-4-dehydrorhamnose reductase